jgi:uncharacterized LabA/DUF88 family protein
LIRPAAPEGGEPSADETSIEAETITAELAREVDERARETVDASSVSAAVAEAGAPAVDAPETFEANIETVRGEMAGDMVNALPTTEEPATPQPRRYRFERRAPATRAAPQLRPERITGAFAAPEQPDEDTPQLATDERENLLALAAPSAPASTVLPQNGTREVAQAQDAYDGGAPLQEATSHEEISASVGDEAGDDVGDEAGDDGEAAEQNGDEAGAAPRRRRRRRRNGSAVRHLEAIGVTEPAEDELTPLPRGLRQRESEPEEPLFGGYAGQPEPLAPGRGPAGAGAYAESGQPYQMYAPFQQQDDSWNVSSAYEQMRQPRSPFGAPEPNTPRGFGQQPQGVATPYQDRPLRTTRGDRQMDVPPISANQLGSIITNAIQQQTDRLLTEMRHTQAPPSMTVMFPPLPSTERVAVFVDVANLLYSSRNLRVAIDFGRLLEFLRGNRRLVRAHAYAPTSPEPHAEQQFLSVVKGVGYRITTKNYKTFSSGAKKADLDLDMCMDIVRMVDAEAVDSVVLVSGDSDFLPLLEYCSDHGVRVEVAAFEDAASMILRQSCDLFVNLSLVDDIRA